MTLEEFFCAVLDRLGAPCSPPNLEFLNIFARSEGLFMTINNPLATTQPYGTWENYNPVGVKRFSDPQDGVAATAITLLNGFYNGIVGGLRTSAPLSYYVDDQRRQELQTWQGGSALAWSLIRDAVGFVPPAPPPGAPGPSSQEELSMSQFDFLYGQLVKIAHQVGVPIDAPPGHQGRIYIVKPGDTLSAIAADPLSGYNGNWQALYADNRAVVGDNPNLIFPGQVLQLRG